MSRAVLRQRIISSELIVSLRVRLVSYTIMSWGYTYSSRLRDDSDEERMTPGYFDYDDRAFIEMMKNRRRNDSDDERIMLGYLDYDDRVRFAKKMEEDRLFRLVVRQHDLLATELDRKDEKIDRLKARGIDELNLALQKSRLEVRTLTEELAKVRNDSEQNLALQQSRSEVHRLTEERDQSRLEVRRSTEELARVRHESEQNLSRTIEELERLRTDWDRLIKEARQQLVREERDQIVKTERNRLVLLLNQEHERFIKLVTEEVESGPQCKVCLEGDLEMLLEPCHHIATCSTCTTKLNVCPICRGPIVKSTRVFITL